MNDKFISNNLSNQSTIESMKKIDKKGNEFWYAKDLMTALNYHEWSNFHTIIKKAKIVVKNSGNSIRNHFISTGKKDYKLSRYACYIIFQNSDSPKKAIALIQSYFAIKTHLYELQEDDVLSDTIYKQGFDKQSIARIRSKGDESLFNKSIHEMKRKYKIPNNRPLSDNLPLESLVSQSMANVLTMTEVKGKKLIKENDITKGHQKNNERIRKMWLQKMSN